MRLDCGGMEFEKLADLLELGQFELIGLPEGEARKIPSDIRLVYMMNDTAESFLVFHEAVMTGTYLPEYEGELRAALDREESDRSGKNEQEGRPLYPGSSSGRYSLYIILQKDHTGM